MCGVNTDGLNLYSLSAEDEERIRAQTAAAQTQQTSTPTVQVKDPVAAPVEDTSAIGGFNVGSKTGGGTAGTSPTEPGQTVTTPTPTPGGGSDPLATSTGQFNADAYLAAYPDVMSAYNAAKASADPNSPAYTEKGLDSPQNFATWHYNTYGAPEGRNPGGTGTGSNASDATAQGNDLITALTKGFNEQITQLQSQNQAALQQLAGQNTSLTGAIQQQQQTFAKSQQELLDKMTKTAAEQSKQFTTALKDLQNAGNTTGQAAKKPNYSRALQRSKDLNGQGLSSTMLTGPGGVAPGSMSLGFTSLLGA